MELLSIFIKERSFEWNKLVAECAERFTSMNALRSSGFLLALADLMLKELEIKMPALH